MLQSSDTEQITVGPRRTTPTLDDIRRGVVETVRVDHLAIITGLSHQKIRNDIHAGYLLAGPGRRQADDRRMWIVTCLEANRYLTDLGFP